jgi:thiol-disulfide isomerase/thioredoxin
MIIPKLTLLITLFFVSQFVAASSIADKKNQVNVLQNFEQLIESHKGKVVYLDFWASWCGPCRKSFPWMNDMQEKYRKQGLLVLSVNVDNDKSLAEQFLVEVPANFNVVYDAKGKIARKFKLKGMPSSYLIDRTGKVVNAHIGFSAIKKIKYEQEIKTLLHIAESN